MSSNWRQIDSCNQSPPMHMLDMSSTCFPYPPSNYSTNSSVFSIPHPMQFGFQGNQQATTIDCQKGNCFSYIRGCYRIV